MPKESLSHRSHIRHSYYLFLLTIHIFNHITYLNLFQFILLTLRITTRITYIYFIFTYFYSHFFYLLITYFHYFLHICHYFSCGEQLLILLHQIFRFSLSGSLFCLLLIARSSFILYIFTQNTYFQSHYIYLNLFQLILFS